MSTTVEPDSNIKGKRFLITNKLGQGIKDRTVRILAGNLEEGFEVIATYEKDILPMTLCQFGAVQFSNLAENQIMMHPVSLKNVDNDLIIIERS